MLYIYHYDIASMTLTTWLLLAYVLRRGFHTRSNWYFCCLLLLNLLSSATDFATAFTISFPADYPLWLNYLLNCSFLIAHNLTGVTFFAYVCIVTKGRQLIRFESNLWKILGAVVFVVIASSPVTHAVFYFDDQLAYTHGSCYFFMYVVSFFLLVYDLVLVLKYRARLTTYQFWAMLFFILAVIGSLITQLVNNALLMENFAIAVSLMLLYLTMENPAEYMYKKTYCYNSRALESVVAEHINTGRSFQVVGLAFDEADEFSRNVSATIVEELTQRVITLLHAMYARDSVFCLGELRFAIFVGPCTEDHSVRARFRELVARNLHIGGKSAACILGQKVALDITDAIEQSDVTAYPFFHIVSYPSFVETVDEVSSALAFGLNRPLSLEGERVSFATRDSIDAHTRERAVVAAVRKALQNRSFQVTYQPIRRVADGRYASAEALLRLIDDDLGFIPPDEFIPLAEANGLAPQVSDYVVEEVCRFWHDHDPARYGVEYLEVNLSAMDFVRKGLEDTLFEIMARYGVQPHNINFEITETAATGGEENIFTASMERMAAAGVTFSVDDFGSGYASINYLIQVPAALVKIDKGILWAAMQDADARTVLSTTLSLVHQLGKRSLCEGVENEAMADMLQAMGCEYFQGYLYARPMSAADYLQFLADHQSE